MALTGDILLSGSGAAGGPLVRLAEPISFWGGVDPASGAIIDARHPDRGRSVAGAVLALPGMIGSSSASAVLLELVHAGHAPAALLMVEVDAILLLGLIVAREMGWQTPPALKITRETFDALAAGHYDIGADGAIAGRQEGNAHA